MVLRIFYVVELYSVDPEVSKETNQANLLDLEQKHLDWVFSLPDNFRYNFSSIAGAPIAGRTHTPETRAQMSDSHTGKTHSEKTRAKMSDSRTGKTPTPETRAQMSDSQQLVDRSGANNPMYGRTGANNPMYGKVAANAM